MSYNRLVSKILSWNVNEKEIFLKNVTIVLKFNESAEFCFEFRKASMELGKSLTRLV